MFRLIALQIIKWKKQWKELWKETNTSQTNYHYTTSTGTSNTKLDPEQEKRMWETFDNSFKTMDRSFENMDKTFEHMNDLFDRINRNK